MTKAPKKPLTRTQALRYAFDLGRVARENGWERKPQYRQCVAENYWLAGYDYKESFKDFHREFKRTRSATKFARIGLNNV